VVKIVELLAPARDMASLNSAINNGADSIYIGITGYNMRANVANFSIPDLVNAVKICHNSNVKLYVCTNTVMKEGDIIGLKNLMPLIKSSGADAVIASDLGALNIARENAIPVHMSVQANVSNSEALNVLQELGVTRVVLSRENTLEEIKIIAENTELDIEVFVHGAMCVAISGRCFLSSHLYDKSANCGECLQPCRKEWKLVSEDDEELIIGEVVQLNFENEISEFDLEHEDSTDKTHIFSPKDLCMIDHIPELLEAGVNVFKIEGRAKPADYVASVTRIYREAIDIYLKGEWNSTSQQKKAEWMQDLSKVFNRGFDTGFYFRTPYKTSNSNQATCIKKDVGIVVNYYQNVGAAEIRLWEDLEVGEEIIIQGKTTGSIIIEVESMQVNGNNIDKISKGQNVAIKVNEKVRPNDQVYKLLNKNLNPVK
jgi:putative protease